MKTKLIVTLAILMLTACAKGDKGDPGTIAPVIPIPVNSIQQEIQSLVDQENQYRELLGQTELSSGLSCSVQAVASGQWLSSSSPGYQAAQGVVALTGSSYAFLLTASINQPNESGSQPNALLPVSIQPLFLNINYRISCTGQIVVLDTAYYAFDLNSDDGSILTIDGSQVINNDGNHGMVDKAGTKLLRQGVHTFSLLYAQTGAGNLGLVLQSNGSIIDPEFFVH